MSCGRVFSHGVSLDFFGTDTKRCQVHIEEALMDITDGAISPIGHITDSQKDPTPTQPDKKSSDNHPAEMPALVGDPKRQSPPSSRMPSNTSVESGGLSEMPSISASCATLERLRSEKNQHNVSPHLNG